ncbi:hypothetical protein B0H10DRAFT_1942666 [Mycena sp. CBHHK59/15]|nr:hypothetical protein B0H10DRAFT_1942666 [Mycena sp. CBHHK59/15]
MQPLLLSTEANDKVQDIKSDFHRKYPFCPIVSQDRATRSAAFVRASHCLNAYLACTQAVFWIRTFLQEGATTAVLARAGCDASAEKAQADTLISASAAMATAAAAAETAMYARSLMRSRFLAAALAVGTRIVTYWGTEDDPCNLTWPPPAWGNGGGWGNSGWGNGGGWWNGEGWGHQRHRWYLRHYGYQFMGAIFCPPRHLRAKPHVWMKWLWEVELTWHHVSLSLHNDVLH